MNRREFISCFRRVALLTITAHAQEAGRIYRLGLLIPATRVSIAPFFDELRINGFVEGQNLVVTGRYSVPAEQIADSAATLVKTEPEVILCRHATGNPDRSGARPAPHGHARSFHRHEAAFGATAGAGTLARRRAVGVPF